MMLVRCWVWPFSSLAKTFSQYNPRYKHGKHGKHDGAPQSFGATLILEDDGNLAIYPDDWTGEHKVGRARVSGTSTEDGFSGTGIAYFAPDGDLVLYKDACSAVDSCEGLVADTVQWSISRANDPQQAAAKFADFLEQGSACYAGLPCATGVAVCPGGRV